MNIGVGDKVRITKDPEILQKCGLEVLLETPEVLDDIYTIKYYSFGYYSILEHPMNQFDIHPSLLIKV